MGSWPYLHCWLRSIDLPGYNILWQISNLCLSYECIYVIVFISKVAIYNCREGNSTVERLQLASQSQIIKKLSNWFTKFVYQLSFSITAVPIFVTYRYPKNGLVCCIHISFVHIAIEPIHISILIGIHLTIRNSRNRSTSWYIFPMSTKKR